MKGKVFFGTLAAAVVLGGAIIVGASATSGQSENSFLEPLPTEEGRDIGLKVVNGKESAEVERKSQEVLNEVDDDSGDKEYEMNDDGYSEDISSYDDGKNAGSNNNRPAQSQIQNSLTHEEAVAIAEEATKGTVFSSEKEYDDGRLEYEFYLRTDKGNLKVEMDGVTGTIFEMEYEEFDDRNHNRDDDSDGRGDDRNDDRDDDTGDERNDDDDNANDDDRGDDDRDNDRDDN